MRWHDFCGVFWFFFFIFKFNVKEIMTQQLQEKHLENMQTSNKKSLMRGGVWGGTGGYKKLNSFLFWHYLIFHLTLYHCSNCNIFPFIKNNDSTLAPLKMVTLLLISIHFTCVAGALDDHLMGTFKHLRSSGYCKTCYFSDWYGMKTLCPVIS